MRTDEELDQALGSLGVPEGVSPRITPEALLARAAAAGPAGAGAAGAASGAAATAGIGGVGWLAAAALLGGVLATAGPGVPEGQVEAGARAGVAAAPPPLTLAPRPPHAAVGLVVGGVPAAPSTKSVASARPAAGEGVRDPRRAPPAALAAAPEATLARDEADAAAPEATLARAEADAAAPEATLARDEADAAAPEATLARDEADARGLASAEASVQAAPTGTPLPLDLRLWALGGGSPEPQDGGGGAMGAGLAWSPRREGGVRPTVWADLGVGAFDPLEPGPDDTARWSLHARAGAGLGLGTGRVRARADWTVSTHTPLDRPPEGSTPAGGAHTVFATGPSAGLVFGRPGAVSAQLGATVDLIARPAGEGPGIRPIPSIFVALEVPLGEENEKP